MHRSLRSSSFQHGKPNEQERNTPLYLLNAGRAAIGGRRYTFDPASNERALVNARTEVWYGGVEGQIPMPIPGRPGRLRGDGTRIDWRRFRDIFSNPPWGNLGPFLECATATAQYHREVCTPDWSVQLLLPLRSHRNYWKMAYTADAWCLLEPVAYEGFDDQMPTPCAWLHWGSDVEMFRGAFHGSQGVVLTTFPEVVTLAAMSRTQMSLERSLNAQALELLAHIISNAPQPQIEQALRKTFGRETVSALQSFGEGFSFLYAELDLREASDAAAIQMKFGIDRILSSLMLGAADISSVRRSDTSPPSGRGRRANGSAKKASKKPAEKAAKKAAKKPPKKVSKKAGKKSTQKAGKKAGKKATQKSKVGAQLGDGSLASIGMKVIRRDKPNVVGTIAGVDGQCAKVRWGDSRRGVKVVAADLVASTGSAATDGVKRLSKTERLDEAITTELLAGRGDEKVSCEDVKTAFDCSAATALRAMKRLIEAGKLQSVGNGRNRHYLSLVPALEQAA